MQSVYPKMKTNQSNRLLLIFIDSNSISPYEFDPQQIFLPSFGGAWQDFFARFSKLHTIKKSKYIELDKKKLSNKKESYVFKMKAKPDKKATINKSKTKVIPIEQQFGSRPLTSAYLLFFKELIDLHVISPLPRMESARGGTSTKPRRINKQEVLDTLVAANDKEDQEFYEQLVGTQLFFFFMENYH